MTEKVADIKKKDGAKRLAEATMVCESAARRACLQDAKTEFENIGNKKREFEVQKLAQGIIDGVDIVVKRKKQLSVATKTDGTACVDSVGTELVTMVQQVATTPAIEAAKASGCRKEDTAVYSTAVSTANM